MAGTVGYAAAGVQVTIDDETLRESVQDPDSLAAWCAENPQDPRTVAHLRILGRLDEAAVAGRHSLEEPTLPALVRAVRRTRYAHVLQWQGAFLPAEEQFDLAAEETGLEDPTSASSLSVLAAVFQHRAKSRFEHSLAEQRAQRPRSAERLRRRALEDAHRALTMREMLGTAEEGMLASSRQTVSRLERQDREVADGTPERPDGDGAQTSSR